MEEMEQEFLRLLNQAKERLENPPVQSVKNETVEPKDEQEAEIEEIIVENNEEAATESVEIEQQVAAAKVDEAIPESMTEDKQGKNILPIIIGSAALLLALVSFILKISLNQNKTLVSSLTMLTYFAGAASVAVGALSIKKNNKGTAAIFMGIGAIVIVAVIEALLLSMM